MKCFLEEVLYLGTSRALLTLRNGFGLACLSSVFVLLPNSSCQQQRESLLLPKSILELRAYTLVFSGSSSSSPVWLWAHEGRERSTLQTAAAATGTVPHKQWPFNSFLWNEHWLVDRLRGNVTKPEKSLRCSAGHPLTAVESISLEIHSALRNQQAGKY